jgi:hypothetical protein
MLDALSIAGRVRFVAHSLVVYNLLPSFRTSFHNPFRIRAPSIQAIFRSVPAPLIRACKEIHQKLLRYALQSQQNAHHSRLLPNKLRHRFLRAMLPDLRPLSLARETRGGIHRTEKRTCEIA